MNILLGFVDIYVNGKRQEWIPIEDSIPEPSTWCWLTINHPSCGIMVVEGVLEEDGTWLTDWNSDDWEDITNIVVAWMPLNYPSPYNKDTILSRIVTEVKLDDLQYQADEKAKEFMFNNLKSTKNEVVDIYQNIQKILKEEEN